MAKSQKTKQREPQNLAPTDAKMPTGAYEVLIGLTYPSDPAVVARIRNGDQVPLEERGIKRVEPGDIVNDIPDCSIEGLLARGAIRRRGEDEPDQTESEEAQNGAPDLLELALASLAAQED